MTFGGKGRKTTGAGFWVFRGDDMTTGLNADTEGQAWKKIARRYGIRAGEARQRLEVERLNL